MRHFSIFIPVCLAAIAVMTPVAGNADQQFEAGFLRFYPQRELGGQLESAYGVSGGYSRTFFTGSSATLHLGGDIGYVTYGKEYGEVPYILDGSAYLVDVQTNNNILDFGLVAKLSRSRGEVRPYAIAKAGYSHFFTETKIIDSRFADTNDTRGFGEVADTTPFAALGGGFLIPIYSGASDFDPENRFRMLLDLRFLWWWGGRVDYLKPGSLIIDSSTGDITYTTIRTRSDRTTAHVGVLVNF